MQQMAVLAAQSLSRGASVRVAIIDTGVDVHHPDLPPNVVARNFVDDDAGAFQGDAHGTAVAGVIAAIPNNGVGIVGIAPDVRLLLLQGLLARGRHRHAGRLQLLHAGAGAGGGDRSARRHHQFEPRRPERSAAHAAGRACRGGRHHRRGCGAAGWPARRLSDEHRLGHRRRCDRKWTYEPAMWCGRRVATWCRWHRMRITIFTRAVRWPRRRFPDSSHCCARNGRI